MGRLFYIKRDIFNLARCKRGFSCKSWIDYEYICLHEELSFGTYPLGRIFATIMVSSNGNAFGLTGSLCEKFTGHWWIPLTKSNDAKIWCFFYMRLKNGGVNNRDVGDLRRHYDVTVTLPCANCRIYSIYFLWHLCYIRNLMYCWHMLE